MFLTETARLANVVLPTSSCAEKEGTFTNFEGVVQRLRKAIEPLGDSLPDWEITLRLTNVMGHPMPYSSLQQVMDEMHEMVPFHPGISYRSSDVTDKHRDELDRAPLRTRRLYKGQFPSGFDRFSPVHYEPRAEIPKDGYSLTLLTGSVLYHSGTGSRSSRSPRLSEFLSKAHVEIGKYDAEQLGISQGNEVRVISPIGEITAVVRFNDSLPENAVFIPTSFPATPVNQLFGTTLDPRSKTPALKSCAVKLERM